jgi:magnesium and cobalt transporter
MLKMSDDERPLGSGKISVVPAQNTGRVKNWFKEILRGRASNLNAVQEALDEFIDELKEATDDDASADNQKILISNVLKTHDLKAQDIMVPRADIVGIKADAASEEFREIFTKCPYSRLPVYKETLDDVIGTVHIKDVLSYLWDGKSFVVADLVREAIIVPPSLPVIELFLMMRAEKKHMVFIVDEFGGIDGLVTMNDVIEAFVGDIEDEFDQEEQPKIIEKQDGSLVVDARLEIEEFEERYGAFLSADERENIDTLAGLAFSLAGRIPKKGESFRHPSGMTFDVVEADPRRVLRLRVRGLPQRIANDEV